MLCKVSVDEVFMHYFQNMSSASGGGLRSQTPNPIIYPPLEEILQATMNTTIYIYSFAGWRF